MPTPPPHAFVLLSQPPATHAAISLGQTWRALVDAVRAWRVLDPTASERDALAGLDERMLKDIGASEWLVADAAMRARDDLHTRLGSWPG